MEPSETDKPEPALLEVRGLSVGFAGAETAPVLEALDFALDAGETLVLLGPSGCGKSLTALALLGLLPPAARVLGGVATLAGTPLLGQPPAVLRSLRGRRIGMVFQEPQSALNPVMSVGAQIGEVLRRHLGLGRRAARREAIALLDAVGVAEPARRVDDHPHQFSGGMKQRALIAMAIAAGPQLLVADEPTTALDVTVQAQVLELLGRLQAERGMGLLFITHDLGVAHRIGSRIAVLDAGRIVETAPREAFFARPRHPASQRLFRLLPGARGGADAPVAGGRAPLLEVRELEVRHPVRRGWLGRAAPSAPAVSGASFELLAGETLAVVGESGCGKSSLARGIAQLVRPARGTVRFAGRELTGVGGRVLHQRRRGLQLVFQDPGGSINPRLRIGAVVEEGMLAQGLGGTAAERRRRVEALLEQVGLDPAWTGRYAHELSGGQRQRVCIARALAVEPCLLICDEPTSALDVPVQAQILALLAELRRHRGLACLLISHDLGMVSRVADRVLVMSAGRIVEQGPPGEVLERPRHPCTRGLVAALPRLPPVSLPG